jgi:hypothetical protein
VWCGDFVTNVIGLGHYMLQPMIVARQPLQPARLCII